MERDEFLGRVSARILQADLPVVPAMTKDLPGVPPDDLIGLFRARAQSVNTVVHGPVSKHSVPRTVTAIAAGHSVSSFAIWDELPVPGVASELVSDGYMRVEGRDPSDVARADIGITGASFGLAESGSVVLSHGAGRSRLSSVLPPVHVALMKVDTIVWTLAHFAAEHPDLVASTANLVIVTGPSRTGDIELHLNLGVHGPKHVHVVLIK